MTKKKKRVHKDLLEDVAVKFMLRAFCSDIIQVSSRSLDLFKRDGKKSEGKGEGKKREKEREGKVEKGREKGGEGKNTIFKNFCKCPVSFQRLKFTV